MMWNLHCWTGRSIRCGAYGVAIAVLFSIAVAGLALAQESESIEDMVARFTDLISTEFRAVVLNEIEMNAEGNDNSQPNDWIELYNQGNAAVDLSGWILAMGNGDREWFFEPIPEGLVIQPHGFAVIKQAGNWLPNNTSTVVLLAQLSDGSYFPADAAFASGDGLGHDSPKGPNPYALPLKDEANDNRSWQRVPDGGCDSWDFLPSTEGEPNGTPAGNTIVFSRIEFAPSLGESQFHEYAEIVNLTSETLDLGGWILKDRNDANQSYTLPAFELESQQRVRIYTYAVPEGSNGIPLGRNAPLWNNKEPDVVELWREDDFRLAAASYWTPYSLAQVMQLIPIDEMPTG